MPFRRTSPPLKGSSGTSSKNQDLKIFFSIFKNFLANILFIYSALCHYQVGSPRLKLGLVLSCGMVARIYNKTYKFPLFSTPYLSFHACHVLSTPSEYHRHRRWQFYSSYIKTYIFCPK